MPGKPGDPPNSRYFAISTQDRTAEGYEATYSTLNAAMTANAANLSSVGESHIFEGFSDFGANGLVETALTEIGNLYPSQTEGVNILVLRAAPGHEVFKNDPQDKTTHFAISNSSFVCIYLNANFFYLEDMRIDQGAAEGIRAYNKIFVDSCFFYGNGLATVRIMSNCWGYFRNCAMYQNGASADAMTILTTFDLQLENCLARSVNGPGFNWTQSSPTGDMFNCVAISDGSGACFQLAGSIGGASHCASTDATAGTLPGSINPIDNFIAATEIVDHQNFDFHLKPGSQFIASGVNLQSLFQDDFESDPRPTDGSAWCRGPDEVVAAAPAPKANPMFFGIDF